MIRSATSDDAAAISRIYNHYILNSTITFEEQPVAEAEIAERMRAVQSHPLPYVVAEEAGRVVGFAYAGPWNSRSAYRFTVETTVYVDAESKGRGYGSQLYEALLKDLRSKPIHAVIGIIALPNEASIALHERFGFRKIAHLQEVGWKFKKRIDVSYWELIL